MEKKSLYKPDTGWVGKHPPLDDESTEDGIFFTLIRQQGATVQQISFVLKNQQQHAVPISEIEEIYFEPTEGIWLFFRFGMVKIEGKNLEQMYVHLRDRKVIEIREFATNSALLFDERALRVSAILYESDNLKRLELQ